jgi:hypothetical protein
VTWDRRYAGAAHRHAEFSNALRWCGSYEAGKTYRENCVVLDGEWLMVANKHTADRPAPQPTGDPAWTYAGLDPTLQITAKSVTFGMAFSNPNDAYYLLAWRLWTVAGNQYSVFTVNEIGQITPIIELEAGADGWTEFALNSTIVGPGNTWSILATVREPDPTPTVFLGNWTYFTPNNPGAPASGQVLHAHQAPGIIGVHKTDADAGDRGAELLALTAGDTIDALGVSWAIQSITDQGTYVDFGVAPATLGVPDGPTVFMFTTETATPITVLSDPDYWLADGRVAGLYSIDGGDWAATDDAYGIDIQIQEVSVSPDWDVMSRMGGSGGGGGGGDGGHETTFDTQAPSNPGFGDVWVNEAEESASHAHPYLPTAGGSMSGPLTLASDPTADAHAATKWYVDQNLASPETPETDWVEPTLLNGWENYVGNPYANVAYKRLASGLVILQGLPNNGSAGTTIFTVPAGFRPSGNLIFAALSNNNSIGRITVYDYGEVHCHALGTATWISLPGITWWAAQ